jgi:hypothetical protein
VCTLAKENELSASCLNKLTIDFMQPKQLLIKQYSLFNGDVSCFLLVSLSPLILYYLNLLIRTYKSPDNPRIPGPYAFPFN